MGLHMKAVEAKSLTRDKKTQSSPWMPAENSEKSKTQLTLPINTALEKPGHVAHVAALQKRQLEQTFNNNQIVDESIPIC